MAVIIGTAAGESLSSVDNYNDWGEIEGDQVYGLGGNDFIYGGIAPYS